LKQKPVVRGSSFEKGADGIFFGQSAPEAEDASEAMASAKSDVEAAVIGHGEFQGPYNEIDHLSIERDPRFPVRVTIQFYKATSNGVAAESDIKQIKQEIDSVYAQGSAVGSLVVGGETGRITEYEGTKVEPASWWREFWQRHELNTGETPEQAKAKLIKLLGARYQNTPVSELYINDVLEGNNSNTSF
jgi:hypothetical protein